MNSLDERWGCEKNTESKKEERERELPLRSSNLEEGKNI